MEADWGGCAGRAVCCAGTSLIKHLISDPGGLCLLPVFTLLCQVYPSACKEVKPSTRQPSCEAQRSGYILLANASPSKIHFLFWHQGFFFLIAERITNPKTRNQLFQASQSFLFFRFQLVLFIIFKYHILIISIGQTARGKANGFSCIFLSAQVSYSDTSKWQTKTFTFS